LEELGNSEIKRQPIGNQGNGKIIGKLKTTNWKSGKWKK